MEPDRIAVRYASVGHAWIDEPAADAPHPAACVIAVHGYGLPLGPWRETVRDLAPGAVTVVPEGPSQFYRRGRRPLDEADAVAHAWIAKLPREPFDARNDAFLGAVLGEVLPTRDVDPTRVFLLGYSQGAGVALHFALSHPERIAGVVGLAGGLALPYRENLPRLAGKPVLWIHGTEDTGYPPAYAHALVEAMEQAGLDLESHALEAGHDLLAPAGPLVRTWFSRHLPT